MSGFYFENYKVFFILFFLFIVYFIKPKSKNLQQYFSKELLNKIFIGFANKRKNIIFLGLSFIFLIIALARPVIKNKPIVIKKNDFSIVVAFDISLSQNAKDLYPNRLEFAKNKFNVLLDSLTDQLISVFAFSNQSFLVSPFTSNYEALKYLVSNLKPYPQIQKGSNFYELLIQVNNIFKNKKNKILLIFTDGGEKKDFLKEIEFTKQNNIKIYIYANATNKGSYIPFNDNVLKDENQNIVITKLNENIKQLALNSNGAYLKYSTNKNDIKSLLRYIKKTNFNNEVKITNNQELFYYPLAFGLLFFIFAISGFKRK